MGYILTLILLALIISLLYLFMTWNFNYWKKDGINGPKPKILYGTQPNIINQKRAIIYDYLDHYEKFKGTEKFIGTFLIRTPQLMVLTPDLAKEVYVSQFRKFHDNNMAVIFDTSVEPMFSLNPFLLKGQEWKEKRAEITPALTLNRIKASYPIMQKVGSKMVDFIKEKTKTEGKNYDFECKDLTQRFTIENVADCVYGIEANAFEVNKDSELFEEASNLIKGLMDSFGFIFLAGSIPFLSKLYRKRMIYPNTKFFFTKLMQDAIKLRKETNQIERVDFLNYIMQLKEKKGLTDIELQALTTTFFLDGYETSATLLAHLLLCLGRNKNIQNKLRKELEETADEDGNISFEKLIEHSYLDMCINETLRIYPPASFSQKVCTEDAEMTNLNGNVYHIKKGTPVVIPFYCFQIDEQYFSNPNKYDPERFNPENGGDKKYKEMGVFTPFGDGPRTCLGQKFALTQVKVAIYELLKNFEINLSDKTRKDDYFDPKNFLLYLDGGIWCIFKELKN